MGAGGDIGEGDRSTAGGVKGTVQARIGCHGHTSFGGQPKPASHPSRDSTGARNMGLGRSHQLAFSQLLMGSLGIMRSPSISWEHSPSTTIRLPSPRGPWPPCQPAAGLRPCPAEKEKKPQPRPSRPRSKPAGTGLGLGKALGEPNHHGRGFPGQVQFE